MMNRAELKAKLIELRFWRAHEIGDPTIYQEDAQCVRLRIQSRLARETFFNPGFSATNPVHTKIVRYVGNKRESYDLASGQDFQLAICASAILLPRFLEQHPECAAGSESRLSKAMGLGIYSGLRLNGYE